MIGDTSQIESIAHYNKRNLLTAGILLIAIVGVGSLHSKLIDEVIETGVQVFFFFVLLPFLPCLLFTVPVVLLLRNRNGSTDHGDSLSSYAFSWRSRYWWIALWLLAAVLLFVIGYLASAGIRYYQKPLALHYRLAHGAIWIGVFFSPVLFLLASCLDRRESQRRPLAQIKICHLVGFVFYALVATLVSLCVNGGPLTSLSFIIPSGYNPGFMETDTVLFYTSFLGTLFVGLKLWIFKRGQVSCR